MQQLLSDSTSLIVHSTLYLLIIDLLCIAKVTLLFSFRSVLLHNVFHVVKVYAGCVIASSSLSCVGNQLLGLVLFIRFLCNVTKRSPCCAFLLCIIMIVGLGFDLSSFGVLLVSFYYASLWWFFFLPLVFYCTCACVVHNYIIVVSFFWTFFFRFFVLILLFLIF